MQTVQIMVNNDRKIPMNLRIVDATDEPWEGRRIEIPPATIQKVRIEIPEGTIPYLKIWETGAAFLSYIVDHE